VEEAFLNEKVQTFPLDNQRKVRDSDELFFADQRVFLDAVKGKETVRR
jgi:hypothetical protein